MNEKRAAAKLALNEYINALLDSALTGLRQRQTNATHTEDIRKALELTEVMLKL